MCGVEVDPVTFSVRVDRYVSMHDAGTLLNPLIADGQVYGAFAQGIAAALYEEFVYDENGSFLSGSFADYLVPTSSEIPKLEILHQETPSPLTPLGAKGMAEGNCMSTPACIANAVADALGVKDISLPLTPLRLHALTAGEEQPPLKNGSASYTEAHAHGHPPLEGEGKVGSSAAEGSPGWGGGGAADDGDASYAEAPSPPPGPATRADLPPPGGGGRGRA
jgi:2-furoyl-CoA dehydrogenase large subunit